MKQNDFYEVDGCMDFIPVKLIEEHKHMTNTLEVELTQTGCKAFVPSICSFPKPHEPQKPVVPKFVAEWIEEARAEEYSLYGALKMVEEANEDWLFGNSKTNQDTFARAWLDGYTVEKEKLYTVEIPNPNIIGYEHTVLVKNGFNQIVMVRVYGDNWRTAKGYRLTESEIKQDFDFLWQFAKEVE